MVLVFTLGGKFTQSSLSTLIELFYDAQQSLSLLGEFTLLVSFLQRIDNIQILVAITQPAASVAGIRTQIEWLIALGGR